MVNQKAQLAGLVQLLAEEQHLSSTEIAETLWLALQIEPAAASDSPAALPSEPADEWLDLDDSLSEPVVADTSDLDADEPEPDELDEPERALSPPSPRANVTTAGSEATALPVDALPVWIADLPMLRDPLALMRSLKPLLQQVEVGVGTEIDESATVERIAQTQLWLPVLKPETEPWFDVVLVVDSSSSMHLWRQLAVDLEQIFRRYGAFRNLQVYDLVVSDAAEDAVRLVTHADRPGHHPGELIEQRGRRIAIVLSDCAAPYWWDGRLLPMLQGWAKAMPMVVWQMLPEWMWERTALGRGQMVSLSNGKPGAANQRLQPLPVGMETIDEADGRSAVPVITSATADLKNWGLMLSGDRRERTPGFLLPQAGGRVPKAKSLEEIARGRVGDDDDAIAAEIGKIAQTRIDRFLRFASPAACQLVMLLAAAPVITLPVMRLVRESMMSEEKDEARSPLPVAEVFLSGLLQRLPEQAAVKRSSGEMQSLDKSQVQYNFIPQSRQLLLKVMPPVETVAVVNRVSAMVEDRWNSFSNKSFKAFLTDPSVEAPAGLESVSSFASITADILAPLGGQYANFAEELRQGAAARKQPELLPESEPLSKSQHSRRVETSDVFNVIRWILQTIRIGDEVVVYDPKGKELCGRLVAAAQDFVVVQDATGKENYLFQNMIAGFELSGPFVQGKWAKDVKQDLRGSEALFLQAIREDDRSEESVKELAQLYLQKDQPEKAIDLLLVHREQMKQKDLVDNLLARVYSNIGMYDKSIERFEIIQKNIPNRPQNYNKIYNVLTQLSYCYYCIKAYDEAESILEQALEFNPEGMTAKSRLLALQEARITGIYGEADKYFLEIGDTRELSFLSDLLSFHLMRCDYAGIEIAKIENEDFTEEDAYGLAQIADQLGTQRLHDKASYYLSAAKILIDKGHRLEEERLGLYLHNFCVAMGDACISEQKDRDVARSYYSEAFLIAPRWAAQLNVKLTQFIMLYYVDDPSELLEELPYAEAALETAFNLPSEKIHTQVVQGLLNLSRLNNGILRHLSERVYPKPKLRHQVQKICCDLLGESYEPTNNEPEFLALWERAQNLMQLLDEKVKEDIAYLQSSSSNWAILEAHTKKVQELGSKMLSLLNRKRLDQIRQVLALISDYAQQRDYAEQEYAATRIENSINQFVEAVERNPTKYSLELFRPYLQLLGQNIKSRFDEIQRAAAPETLKVELAIETYLNQSNIDCQIAVSNSPGKSPASAIEIVIKDSPDGDYVPLQRAIPVKEFLPGGTQSTCLVPLSVTKKAMQAEVFTLYYTLSYSTRRATEPIEIEGALSLPLYSVEDFEEIRNPYAPYANGTTVKNEAMFYGRDRLTERIVRVARSTTASTHFVLYGQKRVGKSSLLYHVKERMAFPLIPVSFTLGASAANLTIASFLFQIIQNMQKTFDRLEDSGMPHIAVSMPSIAAIERNPDRQFERYMGQLQRFFNQSETYREACIVLLIDEFSYLYSAIKMGEVPPTFMQFWKALLEQDYFSTVVVGHGNMRKFINDFPNEFQGSTIKLPYLDFDSARKLIEDPIRIPESGQSRYRGSAVEKLLELTAGSPYYIQIFCNQLVSHMNRKHVQHVTDADIAVVERDLLQGDQRLSRHQFDNLFSASDNVADGITSEDAEKVLREIARKSAAYGYCDHSSINIEATSASVEAILTDLCSRDVLEKRGRSQFKIRVKLFKDWLLIN